MSEVPANFGTIKPGNEVLVSARAVAEALRGHIWAIPNDSDILYDAEFTGATTLEGSFVVKIKSKSSNQRGLPADTTKESM